MKPHKKQFRLRRRYLVNYRLQIAMILHSAIMFWLGIEFMTHLYQVKMDETDISFLGFVKSWGPPSFLLFVSIYLGFAFSSRIAGPVYRLQLHMKDILEGKQVGRLQVRKWDFFRPVIALYNQVLEKRKEGREGDKGNQNILKNDKGFNLIELMVTLAITSVLVTAAFGKIDGLMRKTQIAQGKSALSSLYLAEISYYAESNSYTSRLDVIHFGLSGKTYFNIGIPPDFPPPAAFPQGTAACNQVCTTACPYLFNQVTCMPGSLFALDGNISTGATASSFLANAHTHFQSFMGPAYDPYTITINDLKIIDEIDPGN